jgi:hypothetical protein
VTHRCITRGAVPATRSIYICQCPSERSSPPNTHFLAAPIGLDGATGGNNLQYRIRTPVRPTTQSLTRINRLFGSLKWHLSHQPCFAFGPQRSGGPSRTRFFCSTPITWAIAFPKRTSQPRRPTFYEITEDLGCILTDRVMSEHPESRIVGNLLIWTGMSPPHAR